MSRRRQNCCIPGCRDTFIHHPNETLGAELMCERHWQMADRRLRDRHDRLLKLDVKIQKIADSGGSRPRTPKQWRRFLELYLRACWRSWEAIKADIAAKSRPRPVKPNGEMP